MFKPQSRRLVLVLSLAAALFVLPMAEAQAAQRRPRGDFDFLDRIESRISALWNLVAGTWQKSGSRTDDNG